MSSAFTRRAVMLTAVVGLALASGPIRAQDKGWPPAPAKGDKGSAENPIKLGSNWTVGFLPAYFAGDVAKAHGWSIEVIDFTSSSQRATALAQGSVDAAMLGWAAAIKLQTEGVPVVVIANAFSNGYSMIARKDSGIGSIADFKKKKVAITVGSMNEIHLLSQLANAGVSKDDVDIIQMNLTDMSLALARGDIDVMVSDEPASAVALTSGFGTLVKRPNDTNMGGINANVTTTQEFVAKSDAAAQALITSLVEATNALNANPDRVLTLAKQIFKKDDAVVKTSLQNIALDYRIDTGNVSALADWQLRLKQIKSAPDLSKLITTKYLDTTAK